MQTYKLSAVSKDGHQISALTTYSAENTPDAKGLVIICHGFGEHSGSYGELMERLLTAGYASVCFDQRGHGEMGEVSPEKRFKKFGVIPSYDSLLDDIAALLSAVKKLAPKLPLVLYGHSMGGNIALNYLLRRGQGDFACVILESPWLGLYNDLSPFTAALARLLGSVSPKLAIINKLMLSDITGDAPKAEVIDKDPLYHNRISFRLVSGVRAGCAFVLQSAYALTIPAYLAYAKNERIVSNPAIMAFHCACGDNVSLKEYDSRHAIHNDVNRDAFLADTVAFLDKIV